MKYIVIPYILYNCLLSLILIVLMSHSNNWLVEPDWFNITIIFAFFLFTLISSALIPFVYFGRPRRLRFKLYALLSLSLVGVCYVIAIISFYFSDSEMPAVNYYPMALPIILTGLFIWDIRKQTAAN